MAQEVRRFAVTIPASTAKSANFTADLSFPNRIVRELELRIPPGPRGEVGFAIGAAGQAVIPYQAGQFIVTDDEEIRWPLDGYWDSGSWTMFAYNTGRFPHTLEVRFLVDVPQEVAGGGLLVLSGGVQTGTTGTAG
jgi:hypothetical protein